ncbi:NAD(P)/FAD-dependent oxidoreductase [Aquabacter spiritensis]|uniref:Ferredoxin--NADP reductase n=1 Tax=Aquabacter spiritensis TaxID=933073 RepID=A0A4R3LTI0_9HYPH|nr:NAD(P)/FAD-dependent oxidoreductase [Aquabacter spiritensis]TCT03860.1 thioredoxin reductase (NADPH) [Aquabacter spiritensis]
MAGETDAAPADAGRVCDITIIGAGPVGLSAGFWAGMRRASCRILDSLPTIGGQLTALYPDKWIYDIPGYRMIKARDLVDRLAEQAIDQFKIPVHLSTTALSISRRHHPGHTEEVVAVETTAGVFLSRAVVLAAGHGAFTPRPLPGIDAETWAGRGLTFFVAHKEAFANRSVMIVGGGDSACDWALELKDIARDVVLVHRRERFRAHPHTAALIDAAVSEGRIRLAVPYLVKDLDGDQRLREVTLAPAAKGGEGLRVEVDDLIVQLGFVTGLGPLAEWGFALRDGGVLVDDRMATSLPGIWACGDIAASASKIRLIATGLGEAATAVAHAMAAIRPEAELQPEHSTSAGVPGVTAGEPAMSAA